METARTKLRRLRPEDFENMRGLESDAEVMRHSGYRQVQTPEQTMSRLLGHIRQQEARSPLGIWVAEMKDGGDFVGWFMLIKTELPVPELGYMILRKFWGQGLAAEVCQAIVDSALHQLGHRRIAAVVDAGHGPSIRVLEKLGFQEALRGKKLDKVLGREIDTIVFELAKS